MFLGAAFLQTSPIAEASQSPGSANFSLSAAKTTKTLSSGEQEKMGCIYSHTALFGQIKPKQLFSLLNMPGSGGKSGTTEQKELLGLLEDAGFRTNSLCRVMHQGDLEQEENWPSPATEGCSSLSRKLNTL